MRKRITVNRPADALYAFWRDFRNLSQIIDYVDAVEIVGDGQRSHWRVSAPANVSLEWDAEITEDRPNEHIAWRSVEGAALENCGSVSFRPAPGEWGTELTLQLDFNPPGGIIGDAVTKILGVAPDILANKALYRFKALLETGEMPTTANQPAARNGGRDD